jgi:hypothetical protein
MELHNHMKFMRIPVESCMEVHNHMNLQLQKSSDFCGPYKLSTAGSVQNHDLWDAKNAHLTSWKKNQNTRHLNFLYKSFTKVINKGRDN